MKKQLLATLGTGILVSLLITGCNVARTRDGAKSAQMASDMIQLINDIAVYYTSQGKFPEQWDEASRTLNESYINMHGSDEVHITFPTDKDIQCAVISVNREAKTIETKPGKNINDEECKYLLDNSKKLMGEPIKLN